MTKPQHDKTNKMTCAPSEDSDQHMPRLICLRWAHRSFCWFCHAAAHCRPSPDGFPSHSAEWPSDKSTPVTTQTMTVAAAALRLWQTLTSHFSLLCPQLWKSWRAYAFWLVRSVIPCVHPSVTLFHACHKLNKLWTVHARVLKFHIYIPQGKKYLTHIFFCPSYLTFWSYALNLK